MWWARGDDRHHGVDGVRRKVPYLGLFVIVCVLVAPFLFIVPGAWLLYERGYGTRTQAEVLGCEYHYSGRSLDETCTAAWTLHGRRVVGDIENSGDFEVGKTVTVTVRGGTAYSRSLRLPFVLLGLGAIFLIVPIRWAGGLVRAVRGARPASGAAHGRRSGGP